jgi:N-acetylglutamate synthase-like GNAT family acetyltransferase
MSELNIFQFDYNIDLENIYFIYNEVLGSEWPVSKVMFQNVLFNNSYYQLGDHLVIRRGNELCGFVASQVSINRHMSEIMLIIVKKSYQKQGIGTKLLLESINNLKKRGIQNLQLGGGTNSYMWPGIPTNLPNAVSFFKKNGFEFTEKSYDLVRDLDTNFISKSLCLNKSVKVEYANQKISSQLLKFEQTYFPNWYMAFEERIKNNDYNNILVGIIGNDIVSSLILLTPKSKIRSHNFIWENLLGKYMGGLSCLGVRDDFREKGIGMQMVITASNILKDLGVENSLVGWTWLTDWYKKAGYKIWREYDMSWKCIS